MNDSPTLLDAELVLDVRAETGEGPVWDDRAGELLFVDIPRGRIHRFDPRTRRTEVTDVGQPVGTVALREGAGLALAVRDGFAVWDGGALRVVSSPEAGVATNRMNDGKPDPAGRFWAGTMAYDMTPGAGSLYRLDPDGVTHVMLRGLGVSNGLDWDVGRGRMYFIDSLAGGVDVFDHDTATGGISGRRRFCEIAQDAGLPDGMTLDADGHVWVAVWGAGAVHRYSPDGALEAIVRVPADQTTSCAFGGPDLADLYITSAATGRDGVPGAGGLFRVRPGVRGRPAYRFRG